jgi:hypothetical protein
VREEASFRGVAVGARLAGMTKRTPAIWAERVRASGLRPEQFAEGKGYKGSSLRWAESWLHRAAPTTESTATASRRARAGTVSLEVNAAKSVTAASKDAPRFVPLRARAPETTAIVVEVCGAQIRVTRGFDVALLGDVVRALGAGR